MYQLPIWSGPSTGNRGIPMETQVGRALHMRMTLFVRASGAMARLSKSLCNCKKNAIGKHKAGLETVSHLGVCEKTVRRTATR